MFSRRGYFYCRDKYSNNNHPGTAKHHRIVSFCTTPEVCLDVSSSLTIVINKLSAEPSVQDVSQMQPTLAVANNACRGSSMNRPYFRA
jgi:hypothetical protein